MNHDLHDRIMSRFIIADYSLDTELNLLRRFANRRPPDDVHVAEEMVMDPIPEQQRAMPVPRSHPKAFMPVRLRRGGVIRLREEEAHTATMVAPAAGATSRRSVASDGARMPRGSNAAESDDRPRGQCVVCGKGTYHQCIRPSPLAIDETHHAPLWLCFGCECPTCHTTTVRAPGSPAHFEYGRPVPVLQTTVSPSPPLVACTPW